MTTLNTEPNLAAPDDFYERADRAHRGLTDAQSALVNAKLDAAARQSHRRSRRAARRRWRAAREDVATVAMTTAERP